MDFYSKSTNKIPRLNKEKDNIIDKKPESIKMDILYFKEELLQEMKKLEKNLTQKNKETNETLKNNISNFEKQYNYLKDNISTLSDKVIEGQIIGEQLNDLYKTKDLLYKETNSNKIKISILERETHDSIYGINELLRQTIIYPGVIGNRGKFNTFHEFIDFLLSESHANTNFRNQKIMDLSTFKLKIDKNLNTMGFKIQSNVVNCNSYTDSKIQEILDKIEDFYRRNRKNIDDLRIENSDYVIQLEKDTKDIRNEINNIKRMKDEIYSKINDALNTVKVEKEKMTEKLSEYKEDVDKAKNDIIQLEAKIKELIVDKIGLLFDEQKKANEELDKFKKIVDDYKENIEEKIDNIDNKVQKEQTELFKSIEDINDKLKIIANHLSINDKIFKSDFQNWNNSQLKNLQNNDLFGNSDDMNKINLMPSLKKMEIDNSRNKNSNNLINPNLDNNDNTSNKKLFESLNLNKIGKTKKIKSAHIFKNNINRKNDKNIAFSQNINLYSFNGVNGARINIKRLTLNNKNALKKHSNTHFEEEKGYDFNNYIKYYSNLNKRKARKNSFNHERIEILQKFQKLLNININDINGHLNNYHNISTTSFKVLNENKEIFDRFYISNDANSLSDNKYLNLKNDNTIDRDDNKLNIYSKRNLSAKNMIDECLSSKNLISKKTTSNFRLDKNMIKFKKNNKIIYLAKKQNSKLSSLKGNIKNKKFGTNSLTGYHNYFIGFYDDENKSDKSKDKKKKKNKYKSNNISLNNYKIFDERKNNIDVNVRHIERLIGTKDK